MSVDALSNQMNAFSSSLIEQAETGLRAQEPLKRLETVEPAISGALVANWTSIIYPAVPASIRMASTLACAPSLVAVASEQPHNREIATRVYANFRKLSQQILSSRCLSRSEISNHYGRTSQIDRLICGQLSETAVLGAIWWSIANGKRSVDNFALPTKAAEDKGVLDDNGFKTGVDIKIHSIKEGEPQLIQVKTSNWRHESTADNPYAPGIAVIPVIKLRNDHQRQLNSPRRLLDYIVNGSYAHLAAINQQIDERLERANNRRIKYISLPLERAGPTSWRDQLKKIGEELSNTSQDGH